MKRLYIIILGIMLLVGWIGCQSVDPDAPKTQSELIAMQNGWRNNK